MAYTRRWQETVTVGTGAPVVTQHEEVLDDETEQGDLQRAAAEEARFAVTLANAQRNFPPRAAVTLKPGEAGVCTMPDGSLISVGAEGQVYVDGRRIGTNKVAKVVSFGLSVYALGATDGKWWRWTGSGWTAVAEVDARHLSTNAPA
jgi:hypothetical protein